MGPKPAHPAGLRGCRAAAVLPYLIAALTFSNWLGRSALGVLLVSVGDERGWHNGGQQANALTCFFLGYFANNMFAGWLATQHGGYNVLMGASWSWALVLAALPVAIDAGGAGGPLETPLLLNGATFLLGLACAPMWPASTQVMGEMLPRERHPRAITLRTLGAVMGKVAATSACPVLAHHYGWRHSIYALSGCCFGVAALWAARCWHDEPAGPAQARGARGPGRS